MVVMIEYVNFFLLTTISSGICYTCYRFRKIFYLTNIVMDTKILDELAHVNTALTEQTKPKSRKKVKKTEGITHSNDSTASDTKLLLSVNPDEVNRLIACVVSGKSKEYLGKEYTEQQINEMDSIKINELTNKYEAHLGGLMTKSLGKSIINLYSNIVCGVLGIEDKQELSSDLESDPFLNTALQRLTCNMYYQYGSLLAPVSVAMITGCHYKKNLILN